MLLDILEFLGANELDDRPFIVMPYLRNGNVRDYIRARPDCDRLQIVRSTVFVEIISFSNYLNIDTSYLFGPGISSLTHNHTW